MKNKLKFEIILNVVTLLVIKVDFFAIKMKIFIMKVVIYVIIPKIL